MKPSKLEDHLRRCHPDKTINKIRSNALNSRLLAQLCEENDEDFHRLLLHTEMRWLLKGLCLTRFFSLFETVLEFLDATDPILKENLIKWKTDIAYITDLFTKFSEVNLQLQGDSLNLIKTKSIIAAFLARMNLMKQNIGRREFSQFPNLSMINIQDDDVLVYVQHLNVLHTDFKTRFEDVLTMEIPQWIINPYDDIEESDVILQEKLIGISTNEELKVQFRKGYQQFWLQKDIPVAYPALWTIARKFLIACPSSYLVERSFSAVANLLTKKRNRLQIIGRGDLGLYLTNLKPNIEQLLSEHQVHPSH
ncbi:SCAN domain-containing protein 3-like [Erpetoichthys calabaricus]|uniref:SCAN domain-containing protein 3-like n=1 Tax=Erpetoichthys calabaricus TaxID=27687 RepID=UPI00223499ED|nr:SCAN domain-containing protein 3-like [Erpetoichthys calabaricus]